MKYIISNQEYIPYMEQKSCYKYQYIKLDVQEGVNDSFYSTLIYIICYRLHIWDLIFHILKFKMLIPSCVRVAFFHCTQFISFHLNLIKYKSSNQLN